MKTENNYLLDEVFNDNGSHSHWRLIDIKTGDNLWSENPEECKALGYPVATSKSKEDNKALMEELKTLQDRHDLFCKEFDERAFEFNKLLTEKAILKAKIRELENEATERRADLQDLEDENSKLLRAIESWKKEEIINNEHVAELQDDIICLKLVNNQIRKELGLNIGDDVLSKINDIQSQLAEAKQEVEELKKINNTLSHIATENGVTLIELTSLLQQSELREKQYVEALEYQSERIKEAGDFLTECIGLKITDLIAKGFISALSLKDTKIQKD